MSRDKGRLNAAELPGASRLPAAPACPFCEGTQTELLNAFGAHASVSSYWCLDCRSPFELLKWSGR